MTDKDDALDNAFNTYGPSPVEGRPGVFWVRFAPRTLMAVRTPGEPLARVKMWDAELLVDSAGEGSIIEHRQLDPPVPELVPADFESRALELVRELKAN